MQSSRLVEHLAYVSAQDPDRARTAMLLLRSEARRCARPLRIEGRSPGSGVTSRYPFNVPSRNLEANRSIMPKG